MNDQNNIPSENPVASNKGNAETAINNREVLEKFREDYYSGKEKYCNNIMISAGGILLYAGDGNPWSTTIVLLVFFAQAIFLAVALAKSQKAYLSLDDETIQRHIKILNFERISSAVDIGCLIALGIAAVIVFAGKVDITISASL